MLLPIDCQGLWFIQKHFILYNFYFLKIKRLFVKSKIVKSTANGPWFPTRQWRSECNIRVQILYSLRILYHGEFSTILIFTSQISE